MVGRQAPVANSHRRRTFLYHRPGWHLCNCNRWPQHLVMVAKGRYKGV